MRDSCKVRGVPWSSFYACVTLAVLLFGAGCRREKIPAKVPNFTLQEVRGGRFQLRANHSRVVLLAFLQTVPDTADTPSRRQAGLLMSLQRQYGARGLQVVVVDSSALVTHRQPDPEALLNTSYDWQLEFPLLVDEGNHLAKSLGISQVPSFLLLAADGTVLERWSGLTGPGSLAASVNSLAATSGITMR